MSNNQNLYKDLSFYIPYIIKYSLKKNIFEYILYVLILPFVEVIKFLYLFNIINSVADNFVSTENLEIFGRQINLYSLEIFSDQLINLLITTLIIWIFGLIINWRMTYLQELTSISIIEGTRYEVYKKLFNSKFDDINTEESGTFQQMWTTLRHVGGFFDIIINTVRNFVLCFVILFLIFQYIGFSFFYFGITFILLLFVNRFFSNNIFFKSRYANALNRKSMAIVDELIYATKLIQLSGKLSNELKKFSNLHEKIKLNTIKIAIFRNISKSVIQFLSILFLLSFIFYIDKSKLEVSEIIAFGILASRLTPFILDLMKNINYFSECSGILSDLKKFLMNDFENLNQLTSKLEKKITPEDKEINQIELQNVTFKYGDKTILTNVSISFEKGKSYCILGNSGSGKSTLLDLISTFRKPNSGKIVLNGKYDSKFIEKEYVLDKISYLPQETIIMNNTIRENIAYLSKNKNNIDYIELLKFSELNDFISHKGKGLDYKVGSRGNLLSGGQKQRIGISRTLVKKFDVLIFDEATSNIDSITENKIMSKLFSLSKNKISMFATHRQNLLKKFDSIIIINNKKVYQFNSLEDFKKNQPQLYKITIPS